MQEKNIETLVINKVENQKVYDAMVAANKINSNELYLVGGGEQVTGVKGDKETVFRAGDVNLTASNIGALAEDTPVIKYTEQNLDDNQKTQARTNIGAGTSSFSGRYNDLTGTPPIVYKNNATVISSPVDIVYDSTNTLGIRINPSYRNCLLKISQRDDGFGINLETNSTTNEGAVIINGVATPTDNNHAANKKYVDDAIANNTVDISDATTDTSGLMSAADKVKLNAIEEGANKTTVDGALNSTSTNPVQNKVINTKLTTMQSDIDSKVNKDGNKVLSTNDFTTALKNNLNSAYTHSTSDHAPSNAERNTIVTIKRNGTALTPTDRVVDIIVPTKTSDLTNDSDFATNSSVDGKLDGKVDKVTGKGLSTNDLTNALKGNYDAAYTHSTSSHAPANAERNTIVTIKKNGTVLSPDSSRAINVTVPTKVSELTNDSGYLTSVPVTSVNNKTGAVTLSASDVGAAAASHTHTTKQIEGLSSAIADAEPFVVEMTSGSGNVTINKSFSEIKAAFDAGRICYAREAKQGTILSLVGFLSHGGVIKATFVISSLSSVSVTPHASIEALLVAEDNSIETRGVTLQPQIRATGLLKGSGDGNISAAVAGTDYAKASHTHTQSQISDFQVFHVGTTAPTNTKLLWIDTANGLKYYNGSAWVTVPVAYK